MSPAPTPTPAPIDPETLDVIDSVSGSIALTALALFLTLAVTVVAVVIASRRPFPTSVIASLTMLAALALIGYAVGGEERAELAAIAGSAVGALAGGVTGLLGTQRYYDRKEPGE